MKQLKRIELLDFLLSITGAEKTQQETFLGKNIYLIMKNNEPIYQLEFVPASSKYFMTILLRGIADSADRFNKPICDYISGLALGRNIIVDTEFIAALA